MLSANFQKRGEQHQSFLETIDDVRSSDDFLKHPQYTNEKVFLRTALEEPELFTPSIPPKTISRPSVQIAAWNIERGMAFDGILKTLTKHRVLSQADIFLLTETDVGMARSGNRHVPYELAKELNLYGAFGPAYMNLDKGNGFEVKTAQGENTLALQGHSILSRYPIDNVELISLPDTKDHMAGKERQIGSERAILATVHTPKGPIHCVSLHLSLRSSRKQRVAQMNSVVQALAKRKGPAIIGGDWNTTTYNCHKAWTTILGFWRRWMMGVPNVILNHYPYPERYFEKELFQMLNKNGFETDNFNFPGGCTVHYNVADPQNFENLGDWIPQWCFKFILWSLEKAGGCCSFKLDWFTARGLSGTNTQIVYDLPRGQERFSDHDPILVDVNPI